jgi:hypothetical protein
VRRPTWLFVLAAAAGLGPVLSAAPAPEVAKPGDPIDYRPFFPDRWKAKDQSTRMVPWEGGRVVLLTTGSDLDGKTVAVFLKRFDAGWKLYADLTGRAPRPFRVHNGKPTIAAVPDAGYTCGIGCGYVGATGIEVGGFYAGDYALVARRPEAFPHYYFYEMGRNYYLFGEQMPGFATGFAVFMRYVCMDTLKCTDPDARTRAAIDKAESLLKDTDLGFLQAFTMAAGMGEKEARLKNLSPSDQPVMYASAMLKLRRDHGGDEWVKRFFHALGQCPSVPADNSADGGRSQGLNWLIAASCAAKQDLSGLFADRWRLPVGPKTKAALGRVNWKASDLTPKAVFASLPADELPLALAVQAPGFLTPELRKRNLLADASFENGTTDRWVSVTWRKNQQRAVQAQDQEAKAGKWALELSIPAAAADDARCTQKVTVKPGTRYLLSGWVKTKGVAVAEAGGRTGANLSLDGGPTPAQSLVGTNDWTYVATVFDSGVRAEVTVCARLGYHFSTATGTAWFDDLVLVELDKPAPPK